MIMMMVIIIITIIISGSIFILEGTYNVNSDVLCIKTVDA
jgi:hypothetical protein